MEQRLYALSAKLKDVLCGDHYVIQYLLLNRSVDMHEIRYSSSKKSVKPDFRYNRLIDIMPTELRK